ncbi:zinc finger protein GLIS2 homolog isoform X2 [Cimex lectularius]|uniref:C2H2-type domain-containing protein n=1 Tax=Cimex lectularius TaxID=79782 RepID=A0A8I6TEA0_CIMLE|nr:zinc finger protein GLIS2 homolog isoform X2 [Cimex lectularius]
MVIFNHSQSDSDGSLSSGENAVPHAQNAPVKCCWEMCGYWFSQLEVLAAHVAHAHAVPGKGGLFYCGWEGCMRGDRGFNARYKMLVHVRTHTNERPHLCFKCNKTFSRAENLKIHSRTHTGEKPYVCTVEGCGKAYSNSSDRFKHMRTHSDGKPYVCKIPGCPKRYTDPSSLRKHLKTYRHTQQIPLEPKNNCCKMDEEKPFYSEPQEPKEIYPSKPVQYPWPSLIQWYMKDQSFCTEQDTPLDLTCPLKLQHKV